MNNKQVFLLITVVLTACKDINGNDDNYFLEFNPRKCKHIEVFSKQSVGTLYNNVIYYDYHDMEVNSSVKNNDYILVLYTGTIELTDPIPSLENEIELSYKKRSGNMKSKSVINNETGECEALIEISYRVDGVRNLSISSLDAPLFGKPTGTSLNQYFDIFKYDPDFIASYESKALLYGYTDKDKPTAIDEWLSLNPMAQPSMFLRLNATPENLPVTLRFIVDMETTDGIVISDTTKAFTLTKD